MPKPHQHSSNTVPVSELHTNPLLERELSWFFTEAESAIALPSNINPGCPTSFPRGAGARVVPADDLMEDRVEAMHAAGTIERRLRAMPEDHAVLLFAAFEPRLWPESLEAVFGRVTGIAVRLSIPRLETVRSSAELRAREDSAVLVLSRTLDCGGEPALALLRSRARVAYVSALRTYARVRGLGPSVVPGAGR